MPVEWISAKDVLFSWRGKIIIGKNKKVGVVNQNAKTYLSFADAFDIEVHGNGQVNINSKRKPEKAERFDLSQNLKQNGMELDCPPDFLFIHYIRPEDALPRRRFGR